MKNLTQKKIDNFIPLSPLKTAVLLLVFNRLDVAQKVFEEIRKAKPPKLYIASDGARLEKEGEKKDVESVREFILTNIDWECEVKTLFRKKNLGCKIAVSEAINWFFENEEMGIILEDDCLPSQGFFWFCEELLERYKNDTRVMLISGYNKQNVWNYELYDYFFSNFGGIWGWASWKRAWQSYDINMFLLAEFSKGKYFDYLLGNKLGLTRRRQMENVLTNKIDSWAYQWGFTRHVNSGLACVPSKNLIQNIGTGKKATHTHEINDIVERHDITLPIKNNKIIVADGKYDKLFHHSLSIYERLFRKIKNICIKIKNHKQIKK